MTSLIFGAKIRVCFTHPVRASCDRRDRLIFALTSLLQYGIIQVKKHIALTSGETPERLHKAIQHYKAKVDEDLDREDEEGDIFDDQLT